jgi:GntR family transcriptional regulator
VRPVTLALPVPKYHQVYLVLREQLHEGRFAQGLPGEIALMREFGVARVTVRKALERLAAERLIERTPGRGTVPLPAPRNGRGARNGGAAGGPLSGLLESLVSMGLTTTVKVVSVETLPCPDAVATVLAIAPGVPVQKAVRVRQTRDGPISHITTHVPKALAPFGRRDLAKQPILVLMEAEGTRIGRATQIIGARLAEAEVARHLDVAVGSALLSVQRLIFDTQDRPVQWLQGLYRPDRYQYQMELSRVGGVDAKVWVSKLPAGVMQ